MWQKQQQERFKMQIKNKNLQDTIAYLRSHMLNTNEASSENAVQSEEVNPVMIRKTPKFPSRERHLAIRRRKQPTGSESPESQKSESLNFSYESETSSVTSEAE